MKKRKCTNCGSNSFIVQGDTKVCEYCRTVWDLPKQKTGNHAKKPMSKGAKIGLICAIIGLIVPISIGAAIFAEDNSWESIDWEAAYEHAFENIEQVDGWTQEIYQNIQVATRHWNDGDISYSDGTYYADLVELVGAPNSTHSWEFDGRVERSARWSTPIQNAETISVNITYDEESGMIIDKRLDSW